MLRWWADPVPVSPDLLRDVRDRNPGLTNREIGLAAVRHPDYAADFEELGVTVWTYNADEHVNSPVIGASLWADDPDHLEYSEQDAAAVQALVVAAMLNGSTAAIGTGKSAESAKPVEQSRGITVPYVWAEEAVQLHVRERLGRRKLEASLPGLGEWAARAIIYWHDNVGHPGGLWLEQGRLRYGPAITPIWGDESDRERRNQAIAPTPGSLRLPRP